jgi:hypothetical protein
MIPYFYGRTAVVPPPSLCLLLKNTNMQSTETINQFLNLRAQGWNRARIADHLHVPEPLLPMRSHFLPPIFLPKPPGPVLRSAFGEGGPTSSAPPNPLRKNPLPTNPLKTRIPKGFRLKAQGCRACEATLGLMHHRPSTLKGLRPTCRHGRFRRRRVKKIPILTVTNAN